ncbi:hypothetical protein [Catenulispora rubra]|uniref:hypothetical protein n=1 Tax=Catenulispora rubra TaxID=280293 RepID=UPI0018926A45|nr:hypothetical protein [Catenulispora rubra]
MNQNEALILYRELGMRSGQADALTELGKLQIISGGSGNCPAATESFREALDIYRALGRALDIARVEAALADLENTDSPN